MTMFKTAGNPTVTEVLPPAPPRWPRSVYWLGGGAVGAGAVALGGHDGLVPAVIGGAVLGAGHSAVKAVRSYQRREILDPLTQALMPLLGWRTPDRAKVRVARWTRGVWSLTPQRLVVSYWAGIDDEDSEWIGKIVELVSGRMKTDFKVLAHDRRRCRIVLSLDESVHESLSRERRIIGEIFGKGSGVTTTTDQGEQMSFEVSLTDNLSTRLAVRQAQYVVNNKVQAVVPGSWRVVWDLKRSKVSIEKRAPMPTSVPHLPVEITADNLHLIFLGLDEDGKKVFWNLRGTGPHLLVVGKTGTGKTVAILGAVMEFCRRDWRVWIADPKRVEFMGMRDWPNVQIVATNVEEMIVMIKEAHTLMEERYEQIENGIADEASFEPLGLVLDEYRNFHRQVTAWYNQVKVKGMPSKCEVFEWVAALAEKARTAQIHLVMGTQRPDAEFLTGSMRDNFDSRLALGRLSRAGAMMMWESPHLGTTVPRKIKGRGTAIDEDEQVKEIQVLWTPDPRRAYALNKTEDIELLEALRPTTVTHPPLLVSMKSKDTFDLDGIEVDAWARVMEATLAPAAEAIPLPSTTLVKVQPVQAADVELEVSTELDEEDDGYLGAEDCITSDLEIGDLICVDDHFGVWGVVEAIEEDPDDPDYVCIAWRDDDGEAGQLSWPADESTQVRRPADGGIDE